MAYPHSPSCLVMSLEFITVTSETCSITSDFDMTGMARRKLCTKVVDLQQVYNFRTQLHLQSIFNGFADTFSRVW